MHLSAASEPLSALDILTGGLLALVALGLCWHATHDREERDIIRAALVLKCLAALASVGVWAFYYRDQFVNDNFTYHFVGTTGAAAIRENAFDSLLQDFGTVFVFSNQTLNTDRFGSLSAVLHILTGDSFIGASLLCGLLAFVGQLMLYRTFVCCYPQREMRVWWQAGLLFWPTLVFWSAGLFKDSLGILGLGLAVWGTYRFLNEWPVTSSLLLAFTGLSCLALFRGQVLPVLLVSELPWLAVSMYRKRRLRLTSAKAQTVWREGALLGVLVVCAGGVVLAGAVESRLSLSALPRAIVAESRDYMVNEEKAAGGSTLHAPVVVDPTWRGLVRAWPRALILVLLRPFLWEAPSATGLLAALENSVLLLLFIRAAWSIWKVPQALVRACTTPLFLTSVCIVALFGLGVGASTPNLGTVSRYRIPLLPFTAGAIAILETCRRESAAANKVARPRASEAIVGAAPAHS